MRPARLVAPFLLAMLGLAGCASSTLRLPPSGFYRVPGMAPTPYSFSPEEGAQSFRLEPGGVGVEVVLEAALAKGEVRVVTAVQNGSREPVRYDLRRMAIAGTGGKPLVLAGVSEDPSRPPSAKDVTTDEYRAGIRVIPRGHRNVITRRYRLEDPEDPDAARLLERLDLADELAVGDRTEPVRLHLEKVR
jgi:hypothetical protein